MIIEPAERLSFINEYYFSQKLEQIRQMDKLGRDVINLGIGSPDLAPSEQTLQVTSKALQQPNRHGYGSYRGLAEFREAVANWYLDTYGVTVDPSSEILPLLGSKEGLYYIAMSFLNPGDRALVPNPGYPAYSSVTRLAGGEVIYYKLKEENDWLIDLDTLSSSSLDGVKLMWVNYPHMPTGAGARAEFFKELVDFGRAHKILICHDNPYSLVLNTQEPLSLLRFDPTMSTCLELNSMSKAFNMAGWRVGMLLAQKAIVETVLKMKTNVDSGQFIPLQIGAIEAFKNSKQWHQTRNKTYEKRRSLVYQIFDKLGFTYNLNQQGLFVWAKAPASIQSVETHMNDLLNDTAVFITPGFIFGSQGERHARAALCASEDRLQLALARLEAAV